MERAITLELGYGTLGSTHCKNIYAINDVINGVPCSKISLGIDHQNLRHEKRSGMCGTWGFLPLTHDTY